MEIKIAKNIIDKSVLISLGVNEDQICVSKMPICKIGSGIYQANVYTYDSLSDFKDSSLFMDTLHGGVFVIYDQTPTVDIGIDIGIDAESYNTDIPNYIIRMFG